VLSSDFEVPYQQRDVGIHSATAGMDRPQQFLIQLRKRGVVTSKMLEQVSMLVLTGVISSIKRFE